MTRFSLAALLSQQFLIAIALQTYCLAQIHKGPAETGNAGAMYELGESYANGQGVTQDVALALMWYRRAAESKDPRAMNCLGRYYEEGVGVTQDVAQAAQWYRKGAEAGDIDAMFNLANCYTKAVGVEQSETEAFKWYDTAAQRGDSGAMCVVGQCYWRGTGISKDIKKGAEWYRKAAEAGNTDAMLLVGLAHENGVFLEKANAKGLYWYHADKKNAKLRAAFYPFQLQQAYEQDDSKAFSWYKRAFDAGNMEATCFLVSCYRVGKGTEKNLVESDRCLTKGKNAGDAEAMYLYGLFHLTQDSAIDNSSLDWLVKAANAGSILASLDLGMCYGYGCNVKEDQRESFRWYLKAAENGNPSAMDEIIRRYDFGQGVIKNREQSAAWTLLAAEKGYKDPMFQIGVRYYKGDGVRQDLGEALKWFVRSSENGDERAMFNLSVCYAKGEGVQKDPEEAFKWARKAADQGLVDAIGGVGLCYLEGEGVPQNDFLAYVWLSLAAAKGLNGTIMANGRNGAITWRDQARMRLSPELAYKAQQLAQYWFENGTAEENASMAPEKSASDSTLPTGTGTGFFVTSDGYLLTAAHVVAKASSAKVLVSGKTLTAQIVRVDEGNDLALLKIGGNFTALPVTSNAATKLGSDVFTIGFPNIQLQGASPKLTKGVISGMNGIQDDPTRYQISVAVQPGNSGGPLVSMSGAVIGIVTARLNDLAAARQTGFLPQNVNYAVKSDYALPLLTAIAKGSPRPKSSSGKTFENIAGVVERAVCIVLVYQ